MSRCACGQYYTDDLPVDFAYSRTPPIADHCLAPIAIASFAAIIHAKFAAYHLHPYIPYLLYNMAPRVGFEPTTLGLEVLCSIQLSYQGRPVSIVPQIWYNWLSAGVVQRLVCKFSKLEMGVRFSPPAPRYYFRAKEKTRLIQYSNARASSAFSVAKCLQYVNDLVSFRDNFEPFDVVRLCLYIKLRS